MTEVAYDMIKTFRSSNQAFRMAKFETYIQFIMRQSAKSSIVMNLFMSRVRDVFSFEYYSSDKYSSTRRICLDLSKYKLAQSIRLKSTSNNVDGTIFSKYLSFLLMSLILNDIIECMYCKIYTLTNIVCFFVSSYYASIYSQIGNICFTFKYFFSLYQYCQILWYTYHMLYYVVIIYILLLYILDV